VQHNPLNRSDVEASIEIRPPAVERDFDLPSIHRQLRHVIEPEIFYRYVTGIHNARNILQFDTSDIATNTNEAGYSVTQRFYLRDTNAKPCETSADATSSSDGSPAPNLDQLGQDVQVEQSIQAKGYVGPETDSASGACAPKPRKWASWQISQKFFVDSEFGGALIPDRRNVFDSTLDMTGVSYLTSERNIAPVISRLRFEAIDRLRLEWDLDYDPKAGRILSNNIFAGYGIGKTTFGVGHALLNAADENGSTATVIQSQRLQPFLFFGKPSDVGFSVALNSSYDLTNNSLQYGGVQAVYNWDCCGLQVGYRRFSLGSLRDEGEWLWGFTLASIGTAGNIHRNSSVFPTPAALKLMY
jgi:LPS-assembly protein